MDRPILGFLCVIFFWLLAWMTAIAPGCASAPKREAYRFDMVSDCKSHCDAVGRGATVDHYRMECVCEVSE